MLTVTLHSEERLPAPAMPKSSVEMMDFLQQHYSEEQLTLFQPVWNRLASKKNNSASEELPPPASIEESTNSTKQMILTEARMIGNGGVARVGIVS
jgi:hypothetical protein